MFKILRKQLEFLRYFQLLNDGDTRLQIISNGKEIVFSIFGSTIAMYSLDVVASEFSYVVPLSSFFSTIVKLKPDVELTFKEQKILFLKSQYTFEVVNEPITSLEDFLKLHFSEVAYTFNIQKEDFPKIAISSQFKAASDLYSITLQSSYFVSCDRLTISAISGFFELDKNEILVLPITFCKFISSLKNEESVKIEVLKDYMKATVAGIQLYVQIPQSSLDDIFSEEFLTRHDYDYNIEVDKTQLLEALSRLHHVAGHNPGGRIILSIEDDYLKLESRDHNPSFELVSAKIEESASNICVAVSCSIFEKAISLLPAETIKLGILANEEESVSIKVGMEEAHMYFYLVLYQLPVELEKETAA